MTEVAADQRCIEVSKGHFVPPSYGNITMDPFNHNSDPVSIISSQHHQRFHDGVHGSPRRLTRTGWLRVDIRSYICYNAPRSITGPSPCCTVRRAARSFFR